MAVALAACSDKGDEPLVDEGPAALTELELTSSESRAAEKVQGFNENFFKAVVAANPDKSTVVCSPLSATVLLSMVANASNDELAGEIATALGYDDFTVLNTLSQKYLTTLPNVDKAVTFTAANSVWYHNAYTINSDFGKAMADYYSAPSFSRDFIGNKAAVVKEVNDWTKKNTDNIIEKVINTLPDDALAILANAIYFKGQWAIPFEKKNTKKMTFHGLEGSKDVDMMHSLEFQYYLETATYQAVRMQVGKGQYEVTMVLPKADVNSFIAETDLTAIAGARFMAQKIDFYLPRFKYTPDANLDLNRVLKSLGMNSLDKQGALRMFNENKDATHNIIQKAGVEFNEEGAKGAAVTMDIPSLALPGSEYNPQIPELKFDRPYVFMITEKTTGAMLFAGKVGKI